MSSYFRGDQFVKTPLGPAVPGAQVFVVNQPAVVPPALSSTTPNPTPLATVFSDSGGLNPLAQPIMTDGFGHAFYYAAAGLYTVAIYWNNILQMVLPDQLIGNNGVGSISLQTNGFANFDQGVENLVAGLNINLTPDNFGATVIDSVLPLKTDGTLNADQTVDDLLSGVNMHLTNSGSGTAINTAFGLLQTQRTTYTVQAADLTRGYLIIPIAWTSSFADLNYTISVSVVGPIPGELSLFPASIQSITTAGFNLVVWGMTDNVDLDSAVTIHALGIHD